MNCSNCGQPLGAVAHIWKDQLLCEECYDKAVGNSLQGQSPSTTVFIAKHDDQERAQASANTQEDPPADNQQAPILTNQATSAPHPSLLYPNEQVLWKRTFSKGIIHRNPTFTEVITSERALVLDDTLRSIVQACPLRNCIVVVTNTRRDSNQTRMGYGYGGHYGSAGLGTSHTIGDHQFLLNGNIVMTLHNIADPSGLKGLIEGVIKSMRQ